MICVGLIYAAFCIWYAKVPSDMIITNSNDMIPEFGINLE